MFPILSLKLASDNEFSPKKKKWFKDVPIICKYNKNETSGLLFGRSCWYSINISIPLPVLLKTSYMYIPLRLRHLDVGQKTAIGYVDGYDWSVSISNLHYSPGHILILGLRYKTNNLKEYNRLCKGEDLTCSQL